MEKRQLSTRLNDREKKGLAELAKGWSVSSGTVLRRLILFFNQGKISILELVKKTETEEDELSHEKLYSIRVTLSDLERREFLNAIKGWDFSISSVLRRLVRVLISGAIDGEDLWKIHK